MTSSPSDPKPSLPSSHRKGKKYEGEGGGMASSSGILGIVL